MFGLQPAHLLIIFVVAVLFFVPSRLPELARALRQTMAEFRTSIKEAKSDLPAERPRRTDSEK
ncbi:MAG: twin-arginine translocase TatA/TatE family subunit [Chloroflexi bacterium]|nr:twin-arginine translocase TatA/TatE family subunit [Chloroflexota bacterium]